MTFVSPRLEVEHVFFACSWQPGQALEIQKERLVIGREGADINLPHPEISRQHAVITLQAGLCQVEDLASHNGTFLNGERLMVDQRRRLQSGDQLQISQQIVFRFHDPNSTSTAGGQIGLIVAGDIVVDAQQRHLYIAGQRLAARLNEIQWAILLLFVRHPRNVIAHAEIVSAGWPGVEPEGVSPNAVQSQLSDLRAVVREATGDHEYFESVRGRGYRFIPRPTAPQR